MFWELIAAACAGLGAAGIALLLRQITAKKVPSWTVPAFAGAGMLVFQIYSEYTWFSHQKSRLPAGVEVVKAVEEASPWRPWTFIQPQVMRFMAIHVGPDAVNQVNPDLVLADIYLFQRRQMAQRVNEVFHCEQGARAQFGDDLTMLLQGETLNKQWLLLPDDDPALVAVCRAAGVGKQAQQSGRAFIETSAYTESTR